MADEILIFSMVAVSCFLMGFVIHAVFGEKFELKERKHKKNNKKNGQPESKQKTDNTLVVQKPSQKMLMTVCHKCKRKYPFQKNPMGKTKVECPFCFAKGIIR